MSTVWVVVNSNGYIWGGDCYVSEDLARRELVHFYGDKRVADKFELREVRLHDTLTGEVAGMGEVRPSTELRTSRWIP